MHEFGFFISIAIVGIVAYVVGGLLDARRRALRRAFVESRPFKSDADFERELTSIQPLSRGFGADFRKAVSVALGVDAQRLDPQDRPLRDLRVFGFDAAELAGALERAFDVRVRVVDVVRAGTLRRLALLVHERTLEISEANPPLHRDPVPKVHPPEAEASAEPATPTGS